MTDPKDQITNDEIRTFVKHLKDHTALGLLAWMQIIEESGISTEIEIQKHLARHYNLDIKSSGLLARIY